MNEIKYRTGMIVALFRSQVSSFDIGMVYSLIWSKGQKMTAVILEQALQQAAFSLCFLKKLSSFYWMNIWLPSSCSLSASCFFLASSSYYLSVSALFLSSSMLSWWVADTSVPFLILTCTLPSPVFSRVLNVSRLASISWSKRDSSVSSSYYS